MLKSKILYLLIGLMTVLHCAGQVVISEFMASNQTGLTDEDGDYSDWIELHNEGPSTVDLAGWALTDDSDLADTWAFPSVSLAPDEYLVVFASGKDRAISGNELHTHFKLSADGEYLALVQQDGSTVASSFSPAYPEQFEDVSYGIQTEGTNLSLSAGAAGYLIKHTPGAANTVWPAPHPLFCMNSVARLDMYLSEDAWNNLNTTWMQSSESATVRFRHGDIDQTLSDVEVRPRGNTSIDKLPRSFHVSFNSYVPGQRLFDMEKLNLNSEVNDDTSARSLISSEISRKAGADYIYANHVALVVHLTNGSMSVFFDAIRNNVQSVDDIYMQQRYGTSDANLYKCIFLGNRADLTYRGADGSAYSSISDTYQLKYSGGEDSSYDDFAEFVDVLNNTPEADLAHALYEQFDVDLFLKRLCVDVLTGNWDSYWGNYNNFHLCRPPTENRWTYTAYDFDNTLGIDWMSTDDWGERNIYTWGSLDASVLPLAARLMNVPEFKTRYSHFMSEILDEAYNTNALSALAYEIRDHLTAPLPFEDLGVSNMKSSERSTYQGQWPYTSYNKFYNAYNWPQQSQDQYALIPFFSARESSARDQLIWSNPAPVISNFELTPSLPAMGEAIMFDAVVYDNTTVTSVVVRYSFDGGTLIDLPLTATAEHQYSASLPAFTQTGTLQYGLEAYDDQGRVTYAPFGGSNYAYSVDVGSAALSLKLTELNYHPYDPSGSELSESGDEDDYEFIELQNTGSTSINLEGFYLADGVLFTFPDYVLTTGAYVLVVADTDAFEARYGTGLPVAGTFEGKLSNSGETLLLRDADNREIWSLTYEDGGDWPGRADGKGSTLEREDALLDDDSADAWRASFEYGGTPGTLGTGPDNRLVVNEVLAHTDYPLSDSIEIWNSSAGAIDVGGWWLSDSDEEYTKYQIPTGTIIYADSYMVFNETNHFNISMGVDSNDFALSGAHGDEVWLMETSVDGQLLGFADHVEFVASANGESMARWPNGQGRLYPAMSRSLGASNTGPRVGPVLITEVMYHPVDETNELEYVELYNPGPGSVDLTGWTLADEIDYAFPSNQLFESDAVLLIVPFDPTSSTEASAFRSFYGLSEAVPLLGPYDGKLSNGGGRLTLFRADEPPREEPLFTPLLIEDEVDYKDNAPWPEAADGLGSALVRLMPAEWGNQESSWMAGLSPGFVVVDTNHYTLTVSSAAGGATPPEGTYSYDRGDTITNSVLPSITNSGTRYVSQGWSCLGHDPNQGFGQSMVMELTNNAALTWLWSTSHWVELDQNGPGQLSPASGWYAETSSMIISSTPPADLYFDQWTGQTDRIISGSITSPVVSVSLYAPVSLSARYIGTISSSSNLLQNPSFEAAGSAEEQAAHWELGVPDTNGQWWGTAARVGWRHHPEDDDVGWCGVVRGQWAELGDNGGFQQTLEAQAGPTYTVSGYFWISDDWWAESQRLRMEFLDANGDVLSGSTNTLQGLGSYWTGKSLSAAAPDGTAHLRVTIQAEGVGSVGALQFDDFEVSYSGTYEPTYALSTLAAPNGSVSHQACVQLQAIPPPPSPCRRMTTM